MNKSRLLTAALILLTGAIIALSPLDSKALDKAGLTITQAVVCQDVTERQPVGTGDVFAREIERLYCFTKVTGAREETRITHNWYHNGELKASVVLPVRSSQWRTWSSKTMDPALTGQWMVEILAADGTPLESIIFFLR